MVNGTPDHAGALRGEIGRVLAGIGLRLAPEKTRIAHIDEGFGFLGFRIQRHRQWGSDRRHVYSYPSKKPLAAIRRKVKTATAYQMTGLPARDLFRRLGQITRGWAIYFRHGASKTAFQALAHHLWHRAWRWLRNKHPKRHRKWIRRRYYPQQRGFPEADGVQLFSPATVQIKRHRYRGTHIPTPWTSRPIKITA